MNWELVQTRLEEAHTCTKLETSAGSIFARPDAFDLHELPLEALKALETDEEREMAEALAAEGMLSHGIAAWPEVATELLERRWPLESIIGFEWESGGPMSFFSWLRLLEIGPRDYVCLVAEQTFQVVGALTSQGALRSSRRSSRTSSPRTAPNTGRSCSGRSPRTRGTNVLT